MMVGAAVSAGLAGVSAVQADYVLGNWDTGLEGWTSHQNVATVQFTPGVSTGTTLGTGALKMVPNGVGQNLKLSLNDSGQRQAFMANTHFAIDITFDRGDYVSAPPPATQGSWAKIEDIIINAEGSGFRGVKTNPNAHFADSGNPGYIGGWDNTNFGQISTRTISFDYSYLKDGIDDAASQNYEMTTHNPAYNFPNWIEMILFTNVDPNFDPSKASFYFDNARVYTPAINGIWAGTLSSSWSDAGNWTGGSPNGIDNTAVFGDSLQYNVTVDGAKKVGTMTFNSTNSYTLSGGSLTFESTAGTPTIVVTQGTHTIASPIISNNWLFLQVAAAGTLNLTGPITSTPSGRGFIKQGDGFARIEQIDTGVLRVDTGTLQISHKLSPNSVAGCTATDTLTIESGATLDTTNNSLVIDYDATTPIAGVRAALSTAYAAGAWTGTGLTSSDARNAAATSSRTGIAYGEASVLGISDSFNGQSFAGNAVLAMYTLLGDATFDGKVNTLDFNALAGGFSSGTVWTAGDFNYDGVVDSVDFGLMAGNYGQTLPSSGPALGSVVPEPASVGLVSMAATALLLRRRK